VNILLLNRKILEEEIKEKEEQDLSKDGLAR